MPQTSLWGIGPKLGIWTAGYTLVAGVATYLWWPLFRIPLPYPSLVAAAAVLLAIGLPLYVAAGRALVRAHRQRRLLTTGPYSVCRHPLYGAWIVFNVPALALLSRSWLLLTVPVFMYVFARLNIRQEEAALEAEFGDEYRAYKQRVNAILPTLRVLARRRPNRS